MTNRKRVNYAYVIYMFVLVIQIVDVFVFRTQDSVFASNIILRVIGIVASLVVSAIMGLNLQKFCFRSYGFVSEILWGLVYSAFPVIFVYLTKYLYFNYKGYENLVLTFRPTGFSANQMNDNFLILLTLYILSLLLIAVFKEIFYRGYIMTQFAPKYGVKVSILIETLLYTVSYVPGLVYYLVTGKFDSQSKIMTVFLVLGHLFYHSLCGLKWGFFYKVNGSVWMSVVDHFVNKFLITSFFFTESRLPEKWYIIEIVVIQVVSIILFLPQYLRRDRMNEMAAEEASLSKASLKMGIDDYSPSVIRKSIGRLSGENVSFSDGHILVDSKKLEEAVDFDPSQFMSEEELTLSVRGYDINDSQFGYDNEVTDLDASPSEKSKEFFNNLVGRTDEKSSEPNESITGNPDISRLVKDYFNESFEKHTFTKDKK